jgi:hypothetical protein
VQLFRGMHLAIFYGMMSLAEGLESRLWMRFTEISLFSSEGNSRNNY